MSFEEWGKDHWKVRVREVNDEKRYDLKAPRVTYVFNEKDFLQLAHNIDAIAEHIYDKEFYYIHDGDIFLRSGGQLFGVIGDCEELNRLYKENQQLKQSYKEILRDLEVATFDKELLQKKNEQLKQFQEQVASIIESKMGDNVCNDYKMEVLKEIWNELKLDEVWFE